MTEKLTGLSSLKNTVKKSQSCPEAERAAVRQLVQAARERGEDLTGPDGLLKMLTKTVLDEEMTDHLGYDKHPVDGRGTGNSRYGTRDKTVLTDNVGQVTIEVPGIGTGPLTRSSCASVSGAWVMWTRWCSRCTPKV